MLSYHFTLMDKYFEWCKSQLPLNLQLVCRPCNRRQTTPRAFRPIYHDNITGPDKLLSRRRSLKLLVVLLPHQARRRVKSRYTLVSSNGIDGNMHITYKVAALSVKF